MVELTSIDGIRTNVMFARKDGWSGQIGYSASPRAPFIECKHSNINNNYLHCTLQNEFEMSEFCDLLLSISWSLRLLGSIKNCISAQQQKCP